jgi:hypothetical protein
MKRILLGLLVLSACEDTQLAREEPFQEYNDGDVTVIGQDEEVPIATGQLTDEDCLQVTETDCVPVAREGRYCKTDTGPADVIVVDGMVQEVVCYEDTDGTEGTDQILDGNNDGNIDIPQQDNGAVITFDESTNGVPIEGDVVIDGNDVTIYGNGPDKSIINGNLLITGNNARVRGIRVTGNVTIDLNTAALVLSVVEGNLIVEYNNCLIAENDVFGNIVLNGNNTIAVNNGVAGNFEFNGSGTICQDNHKFADANGDKIVTDDEVGAPIECPMAAP